MSSTTDTKLLASVGKELFSYTIQFICFSVLYTIHLLATSIALKLLSPKPRSTRKFLLLSFMCLLVVIDTLDFLVTLEPLLILSKRMALVVPLDDGLLKQSTAAQNAILPWYEMSVWLVTLKLCISDSLVIWRAIAIWDRNHYVKWSLVTLMTCNGAVLSNLSSVNPVTNEQLGAAAIFTSLATNAAGTASVALKLWIYWSSVRTILAQSFESTAMQRLLLLLVESGAVLFVLQFAMAMLVVVEADSQSSYSFQLATDILDQFFEETYSLYPVAVVIMINLQSSVIEATVVHSGTALESSSKDNDVDCARNS
ncbi:hypothetical protein F5878DRAFT_604409 [Lentinula raphanica]|uniref:Uncharacterized protein n=1 Tax=Lentinula raphanica TaxID=153919 RepID=A0AA38PJ10_9AGAR|nr:hypothetical protein F5878DRAFT_604409 [Lentinula raphanica]